MMAHITHGISDFFLAVRVILRAVSKKVIPPSYAFRSSFFASSKETRWIGRAPNPFLSTVIPVFPNVTFGIIFRLFFIGVGNIPFPLYQIEKIVQVFTRKRSDLTEYLKDDSLGVNGCG